MSGIAAEFAYVGEGLCQDASGQWLTSWERNNETLESCRAKCFGWSYCVTFDVMHENTSVCNIRFQNVSSCLDAAGINTTTHKRDPWGCTFYASAPNDVYTGGTVIGKILPGRSCFEKVRMRTVTKPLQCGACECSKCKANSKWDAVTASSRQTWNFWCGRYVEHPDLCPPDNCNCVEDQVSVSITSTTTAPNAMMQQLGNQGELGDGLIIAVVLVSCIAVLLSAGLVFCVVRARTQKEAWTPYGQKPAWAMRISGQFQQSRASRVVTQLRRSLKGRAAQHAPTSPHTAPAALPVAGVPGQQLDLPKPPSSPSPSPPAPETLPSLTIPVSTGVSCTWHQASPRIPGARQSPRRSPRQTGQGQASSQPISSRPRSPTSPQGSRCDIADAMLADAKAQRAGSVPQTPPCKSYYR